MGTHEEDSLDALRSLVTVILGTLVLAACRATDPAPVAAPVTVPGVQVPTELEKLPSTLSIPHFREMTLSGTSLRLERVLERNDVYTKHAISYLSNGLRITGVFLIPNADGPPKLLVFNHGYIDPAVYTQGRGLRREEDYMARKGFAVLHTDYRGHAGSDPSPMVEKVYDGNLEYAMDSANAILAVREAKLPRIDATKVGMLGHSLGGGVTLAILTGRPDLVNAAVLYAPVHSDVWENFLRWRAKREEGDRTVQKFGLPEAGSEWWTALSPSTFLSEITAPVLLVQGSADKDVPKAWSDTLATRMKDAGKTITYVEYDGEGHEFSRAWPDFMAKTSAFFAEALR